MIFRKDERVGGVIVCDMVYLGVVSTSRLLSCDKSQSSLLDDILPLEESMTFALLLVYASMER